MTFWYLWRHHFKSFDLMNLACRSVLVSVSSINNQKHSVGPISKDSSFHLLGKKLWTSLTCSAAQTASRLNLASLVARLLSVQFYCSCSCEHQLLRLVHFKWDKTISKFRISPEGTTNEKPKTSTPRWDLPAKRRLNSTTTSLVNESNPKCCIILLDTC